MAILIVFLGHTGLPTLIRASTGVTIFFFLSGYLITTLLRVEADKRGRISIKDFYLRRVLRIFPPLYIVLLIAIALTALGVLTAAMTGWGIFASGGFWTNYYIIFADRDGLPGSMNALWSLAVEEHFYLIFPLLYVAMRKWLPRRLHQTILLVAVCFIIMIWRLWLHHEGASSDRLYLATDTRADAILWGSVLAIGFNPWYRDEILIPRRAWLLTPVLVASAVVFYLVSRTPDSFGMTFGYTIQSLTLFGIFVPLIVAPRSVVGRILNWRPIMWIGAISYTLYLVHEPVLEVVSGLPFSTWVNSAIGLAIALLLSGAMKVLIEDRIRAARTRRRHAASTSP